MLKFGVGTVNKKPRKSMNEIKRSVIRPHAAITSLLLGLSLMAFSASAAPKASSLNVIPTITNITVLNGQLVASGVASVDIKGRNFTAPFSNVPVNLSLASNQSNAPAGCPILDLALAPINLDLLGLVVQTSPICLNITALPAGGLLGGLLCNISHLLQTGIPLSQILSQLSAVDLNNLTSGLTGLLNGALQNLLGAVLANLASGGGAGECAVLNLALGPVNLNLLGLQVVLDNCNNGPVTVDITAHHGALLGNLLCNLAGHGQLGLGSLLGDILGGLLNLGPL
jgi:hypothetical protein